MTSATQGLHQHRDAGDAPNFAPTLTWSRSGRWADSGLSAAGPTGVSGGSLFERVDNNARRSEMNGGVGT